METKSDILTLKEIKTLVDTFYENVREDELLKDIFDHKIQDRWPEHLEKMYRFWQTVLLEEHTYFGRPFPPHLELPVDERHFIQWQTIFHNTIDALFTGEKANEAKWRASKMAEMFQSKISYYKANSKKPLR